MKGQKSGKPSRPSKFQPGNITHKGYVSDSGNRIMPWWPNSAFNIRFPNCPQADPNNLAYGSVKPPTPCANPDMRGHRPDIEGMHNWMEIFFKVAIFLCTCVSSKIILHPKLYKKMLTYAIECVYFSLFWPPKAKIDIFLSFMLINFISRTLQCNVQKL